MNRTHSISFLTNVLSATQPWDRNIITRNVSQHFLPRQGNTNIIIINLAKTWKTRARQTKLGACRAEQCQSEQPDWNVGTPNLPAGPAAANDGSY